MADVSLFGDTNMAVVTSCEDQEYTNLNIKEYEYWRDNPAVFFVLARNACI